MRCCILPKVTGKPVTKKKSTGKSVTKKKSKVPLVGKASKACKGKTGDTYKKCVKAKVKALKKK